MTVHPGGVPRTTHSDTPISSSVAPGNVTSKSRKMSRNFGITTIMMPVTIPTEKLMTTIG